MLLKSFAYTFFICLVGLRLSNELGAGSLLTSVYILLLTPIITAIILLIFIGRKIKSTNYLIYLKSTGAAILGIVLANIINFIIWANFQIDETYGPPKGEDYAIAKMILIFYLIIFVIVYFPSLIVVRIKNMKQAHENNSF
jgi:hypothetical protein